MDSKRFDEIVDSRLASCREVLTTKEGEYATARDRMHNFKTAGAARGKAATTVLEGMLLKHVVSVWDMVDRMEEDRGYVPTRDLVGEKLGDVINYLLLLEGLIEDRREEGNERDNHR